MKAQRVGPFRLVLFAGAGIALAGCTQSLMNPTVHASPGPGKTPDLFKLDDNVCRSKAMEHVASLAKDQGSAVAAGGGTMAVLGTLASAAGTAAGSQNDYDTTYVACMTDKGDIVGAATPVMVSTDPGLVRDVQRQLIRLGYLHDVADGVAGPKTSAAISQYEQAAGMAVDGAPSDVLLAKLRATSN